MGFLLMKKMDTWRASSLIVSIFFLLLLAACAPETPVVTPYLPPTSIPGTLVPVLPIPSLPADLPIPSRTSTPPCSNDLAFIDDLTIPDYSTVSPGDLLDKQWLVRNSGTCDWNSTYRLRFIGGDLMGASADQALFPARSGVEAVLRILFTAPADALEYVSIWQAFAPDGQPFGEAFLIRITVVP
jgi:hypothetical protein